MENTIPLSPALVAIHLLWGRNVLRSTGAGRVATFRSSLLPLAVKLAPPIPALPGKLRFPLSLALLVVAPLFHFVLLFALYLLFVFIPTPFEYASFPWPEPGFYHAY